MYIKGKEDMVVDALNKRVHLNHIEIMSSYGTILQDQILQAGQQDGRYMELMHKLQQAQVVRMWNIIYNIWFGQIKGQYICVD